MIKIHQRVVHHLPLDCPQNYLFAAFTQLSVLDCPIRPSFLFSLYFFVYKGVEGNHGMPANPQTCLAFIEEVVVTSLTIAPIRYQLWPFDFHQWSISHSFAFGSYQTSWTCPNQAQTDYPSPWADPKSPPVHRHTWPDHSPDPAQLPKT